MMLNCQDVLTVHLQYLLLLSYLTPASGLPVADQIQGFRCSFDLRVNYMAINTTRKF